MVLVYFWCVKEKLVSWVERHLTYFRIHLLYFVLMSLLGGFVIWILERDHDISYVDTLFTAVSALCVTGLTTVDFSKFHISSQLVTYFLIMMGSTVLFSIFPVVVRRHYLKQYLRKAGNSLTSGRNEFEFHALGKLLGALLGYFFISQILGAIIISAYCQANDDVQELLNKHKINAWWYGFFHATSSFNNAGFALLADNMISFAPHGTVLLTMAVLILLGNTAFPIALRIVIWASMHASDFFARIRNTTSNTFLWRYLLIFPRRVYTHVFNRVHTQWLAMIVIAINLIEFVFFLGLDWDSPALSALTSGQKVVNGIFQSISTRTAGLNSINLAECSPPMWVLWAGMMALSSIPITLLLRQSTTIQQSAESAMSTPLTSNSTAKLHDNDEESAAQDSPMANSANETRLTHRRGSVRAAVEAAETTTQPLLALPTKEESRTLLSNLKGVMMRDAALLYSSFFVICLIEKGPLLDDPDYTIFKILFEIASAYGTVGLSLGYRDWPVSFSGAWNDGAKLVLCLVMLLGRHRGLPLSIDPVVALPVNQERPVEVKRRSFELKGRDRGAEDSATDNENTEAVEGRELESLPPFLENDTDVHIAATASSAYTSEASTQDAVLKIPAEADSLPA